jgi:hypothetical protein
MVIALILFAIAALGGITLAAIRLRGTALPPMWLALVHGAVAAAGLVALILAVVNAQVPPAARTALAGFLVAALGGFALFAFHLRRKALPIPLVVVHGLVAVISFVILLLACFAAPR